MLTVKGLVEKTPVVVASDGCLYEIFLSTRILWLIFILNLRKAIGSLVEWNLKFINKSESFSCFGCAYHYQIGEATYNRG